MNKQISDQVLEFARTAHQGQYRKYSDNKLEYITHPIAVAEIAVNNAGRYNRFDREIIRCIAYLHDVIEDTKYTATDIFNFLSGLVDNESRDIILLSVKRLSKDKDTDLFQYLNGIKYDEFALLVKLADNEHNSSDLKDKKKLDYYSLIRYYLNH